MASHDTSYAPSPTAATLAVAADAAPAAATVVYARAPQASTTLDLSIGAMYLTQSTQTLAGAVPLVQNRDGYLRVFVLANQANSVTPAVRVRFYVNGALQGSPTIIAAPSHAVPTSIAEGTLASSWNMSVPGSMIKPGLSILANVDPTQAIAEARRDNNSFPASGTPLALTVKNLSTFYLRFVPVRQSVNDLTGVVSSANKDALLTQTLKIHPISSYSADVHATYTTNALALTGSNGNGAWSAVLGEILALRTAEGSQRNYFGIVKTSYQSGIAGISYIGAGASVGWDGSGEVDVVAHELGHSWGRSHAPCGINGSTDPSFPYPAGNIGVYGFNVATKTLYPPATADVMSYCHPQWISDYTYKGVYNFRVGHPTAADVVSADLQPCIIVWGHIADGTVVLEPSFEALTHPSLPERGGAYALRALDADWRAALRALLRRRLRCGCAERRAQLRVRDSARARDEADRVDGARGTARIRASRIRQRRLERSGRSPRTRRREPRNRASRWARRGDRVGRAALSAGGRARRENRRGVVAGARRRDDGGDGGDRSRAHDVGWREQHRDAVTRRAIGAATQQLRL